MSTGPRKREYSDLLIYRRLLREARTYWPHIVGVLLLSLLATPLSLLTPIPLKIVVDGLVGADPLPGLFEPLVPDSWTASIPALFLFAAGLVILIALLTQLQSLGLSFLSTYTGERLALRFRERLFRHSQRLSLCYHDRAGTTDSVYRIQYDAPAIQWIAIDGVIPFVTAGVTLVGMIYVIATLSLQLALVALIVAPLLLVVTRVFQERLRTRWHEVMELEQSAFAILQESLSSLRLVKAFGREVREQERFEDRHSEGVGARVGAMVVEGGFGLLIGLLTASGTAAVLYLGARSVSTGALTVGELLIIMSYIGQLYAPLELIGRKVTTLQKSLASAERAFSLLDQTPEVVDRPNARRLDRARGDVAFRGVWFGYEGGEAVLRNVDLDVPVGSTVGIAGPTGAGKSTLVSLLVRFYDPDRGRVLLDGVDLRDYRLSDLRGQFSIVLQDTVLFSSSVSENIAYARPGATEPEIRAAARAANADEFIRALPHGYDTVVGERGMLLSGGERQRIALARAFLRDAPVLVLDEPTSALDTGTEALVLEAMGRLVGGRTTFMIAHRISTLEGCDILVRVENGLVWATRHVRRALTGLRSAGTPAAGTRPHGIKEIGGL